MSQGVQRKFNIRVRLVEREGKDTICPSGAAVATTDRIKVSECEF